MKLKNSIVIGVDPDCLKSGFAVYENGILVRLKKLTFDELLDCLKKRPFDDAVFVVEDANLIAGMYKQNQYENPKYQAKVAQDVGRVKMLSTCIIAAIRHYGYKVKGVRAQGGNWAKEKNKNQFKLATGWTKRSCEETRSAEFFGFIYQDRLDDAA